jgi:hypothetical protein
LVNFLKTSFTSGFLAPYWLFALGGLFILVTLALPKGIVGTLAEWLAERRAGRTSPEAFIRDDEPMPGAAIPTGGADDVPLAPAAPAGLRSTAPKPMRSAESRNSVMKSVSDGQAPLRSTATKPTAFKSTLVKQEL